MLLFKLAYKNIIGAGLRTWLNVGVLSFSFVALIWTQGFNLGMGEEINRSMIDYNIGGGNYWVSGYDPYDPFTLNDSHKPLPAMAVDWISKEEAAAVLIRQGSIYPEGRMQSVLLKGIDPQQKILKIPSQYLDSPEVLPALIGQRMAKKNGLKTGDFLTIRWRDAFGTFDALDARIVHIMNTKVSAIDNGQLWLPLDKLQQLMRMPGEATKIIVSEEMSAPPELESWVYKSQYFLLKDIRDLVKQKSVSTVIMFTFMILLAALAIFDAQVLSIFRRRKEIGTLMALGLTRLRVVLLFTIEGAFNGILAVAAGAVYGIPLLVYFAEHGLPLPDYTDSMGLALSRELLPVYSASLIMGTIVLVFFVVLIVSYLPSRRINSINPTDALKGKLS